MIYSFRERLIQAMCDRNIKPAELSQMSGVDKGSISNYINGKYVAKQDKAYKLAKALGVDPGWLLNGDEPVQMPPRLLTESENEMLDAFRDADERARREALLILQMNKKG